MIELLCERDWWLGPKTQTGHWDAGFCSNRAVGRDSLVSMMQTANLRNFHNSSHRHGLHRSSNRRVLTEGQMRSGSLVVFKVRLQNPAETRFAQDDHIIETLPANRANESLNVAVLPGRLRSCENLPNAEPSRRFREPLAIASVPVPQKIARCAVPRECFEKLMGYPFGRGMLRNGDVDNAAAIMRQNHEDKQHPKEGVQSEFSSSIDSLKDQELMPEGEHLSVKRKSAAKPRRSEENNDKMIANMRRKTYRDMPANSTESTRTDFLVGTPT